LGLAVLVLMIAGFSHDGMAQLGIGIKVPSTTVFIANHIDANTLFEIGASISALSNSVIALSADGKIYFSSVGSQLVLEPFIGAGVGVSFIDSTIYFSPFVLAGADAPIPNSPITAFFELGLSLSFSTFGIGFTPGGEFGMRLDF